MASITFYGQTATVKDLSCASVMPAAQTILNWPNWQVSACSADPVATGTSITFVYPAAPGVTWQSPITNVVDNPPSTTGTTVCQAEPFDYTAAAQLWGGAFSVTIALYLVAFKVGTVLRLFR